VSRARNSSNLKYHGIAAVISSIVWLIVIRNVVVNFGNVPVMVAYVVGSTIGSLLMHHIAMKYFEKKKS
jgi:hypothetical protein